MVNFRKTLMVVASLAISAGLASAVESGMVITTPATFTAALVRSEGVTEAVPTVTFAISNPVATSYDVTVISTAPITSLKSALTFNGVAASTISGNAATFSAVPFTLLQTGFSLSGLRVDATQLPSLSSGQTTGLGENIIIIMSSQSGAPNAAPFDGISPITTVTGLAYSVKSLTIAQGDNTGATSGSAAKYTQCQTTPFDPTTSLGGAAFSVTLGEGFGTAWQAMAAEGADATQGTQFAFTFSNVPANVTLYVPVTNVKNGVTLNLVATKPTLSKDGNFAAVPASGAVLYEVGVATSAADTTWIPVYVSYNAGTVPALTTSAAPLTVTGSYAPQSTNSGASGSKDLIPRFLGAAQSSHAFAPAISACTSTILFPYVVNTPGYDTGLAVSNAGNLTGNGGQTGTCQWDFYGDSAPAAEIAPSAAIAPGTTNAALLSALAPGFSGFAVATCNFQNAYGYAFIVGKLGGNEVAQGYLGLLGMGKGEFGFGFFPAD